MHGDCKELVAQIWQQEQDIISAIAKVPDVLIPWNKEKFGNITYKKRKLKGRLDGIQRALAIHRSSFLVCLEKDLMREYNDVLR